MHERLLAGQLKAGRQSVLPLGPRALRTASGIDFLPLADFLRLLP